MQDTSTLMEIMKWRRDVRHFKTDPLPENVTQKLMTAMAMAPSVGNSRPWRVVRVESKDIRQRIVANYTESNMKASELYEGKMQRDYLSMKLAGLKEAPLQLAVFTDLDPNNGRGLGRQTMPETLQYSTVIAIHQLWLIARTLNIGVGWVSILNADEINQTLSVNPDWLLTAYLCIGYPQTDDTHPELHKNKWQENDESEWIVR